jgi:hypothetical protein
MEEASDRPGPGAGTATCSLGRHRTCTRVHQDVRASFLCVQCGALLLAALAAPGASAFLPCLRSWVPASRQHHGTPRRPWVSASASASGTGPVGGFAERDFIALQVFLRCVLPELACTPNTASHIPASYSLSGPTPAGVQGARHPGAVPALTTAQAFFWGQRCGWLDSALTVGANRGSTTLTA